MEGILSMPIVRRLENRRLAYYGKPATAEEWDSHWHAQRPSAEFYAPFAAGEVGFLGNLIASFLPKDGKILEAGCGQGQYVLGLRALGFDCEGIDYAAETVAEVRATLSDLPIRVGDVTAIDAPDAAYRGYISLGVVEHFKDGPSAALAEARRVLAPGGTAIIAVPCFNALRRLKARLGFYRASPGDHVFYQYAYDPAEMHELLTRHGFRVIAYHGYDCFKGLKDELPFVSFLAALPKIGWRLKRWLRNSPRLNFYCGHMGMFVTSKVP